VETSILSAEFNSRNPFPTLLLSKFINVL